MRPIIAILLVLLCSSWATAQVRVDVWHSKGCGPCQQYAPTVARLQKAMHPVTWNDVARHPEIAKGWGITATPTTIFTLDGQERERVLGPMSYRAVVKRIEQLRRVTR